MLVSIQSREKLICAAIRLEFASGQARRAQKPRGVFQGPELKRDRWWHYYCELKAVVRGSGSIRGIKNDPLDVAAKGRVCVGGTL
jgi:hypothetical protein